MRADIELRLVEHDGRSCLLVDGVPGDTGLAVVPSALAAKTEGWQPVAGMFDKQDGTVWFVPRFPLVRGLAYSLLMDGVEVATVEVPSPALSPTAEVVSIHPTAAEVPLNLLRVYVSFSAPMSEGFAARSVRVLRLDTREPLEDVFLPLGPELWDHSRQRLTLLLDPGRIKRGLVPNLEAGYPLTEGVSVAIVVDAALPDATGTPLRAPSERRYNIGPALRGRINPHSWRLSAPTAGSDAPLLVTFDRSLDRALLGHCLVVVDAARAAVLGHAIVDVGERAWRFAPSLPWSAGSYTLQVDARLEDIAGNSVRRVFDRDLDLTDDDPLEVERVDVPFAIV
jgi:hypothetical protein